MTEKLTLPTVIALCSIALGKPALSYGCDQHCRQHHQGRRADQRASGLSGQRCEESSAADYFLGTVPPELIGCFNLIFYQSAEGAVFKALGVE